MNKQIAYDNHKYQESNAIEDLGETYNDCKGSEFESGSKCNDFCFSILFIAHLIGLLALFTKFAFNVKLDSATTPIFEAAFLSIAVAIFGSYLYVNLGLSSCPAVIINMALFCNCAFMGVATIVTLLYGNAIMGLLFAAGFVFLCWYWYAIQSRIPFAVTLIEIAIQVLRENSGLWAVAAGTIVTLIGYFVIWALTFFGYSESLDSPKDDFSPAALIGFVFSGYWGYEVIRYVLFATSCGVTASWILQPETPNATRRAFTRAAIWSFGSICFGGLLLAAIRTIEFVARLMASQRDGDNALAALVSCVFICILRCIEEVVEYLNEFGFTFVSVYGMSYCAASKSVWELLKGTGFESIIQFDLSQMALWIGCLVVGLISGIASYLYAITHGSEIMQDHKFVVALGGFLLAFLIVYVVTMAVKGAIITTFVIWAMEPAQFASARPQEVGKLVESTQKLAVGGYLNMDLANRINQSTNTGSV